MNSSLAVELNHSSNIRRDAAKIILPNEVIDTANKILINFFTPKAQLISHENSMGKPRIHLRGLFAHLMWLL
jgi:hypothetical protein